MEYKLISYCVSCRKNRKLKEEIITLFRDIRKLTGKECYEDGEMLISALNLYNNNEISYEKESAIYIKGKFIKHTIICKTKEELTKIKDLIWNTKSKTGKFAITIIKESLQLYKGEQ